MGLEKTALAVSNQDAQIREDSKQGHKDLPVLRPWGA